MFVVHNPKISNSLFNCLSIPQREWLVNHSTPVELIFGQVLNTTDDPIKYVYFPLDGFISVLIEVSGEPPVEMALIGSEGMLGATLALGKLNAPMLSVVQGAGIALRMDAQLFRQRLKNSFLLRNVIHSYLYVLIQQLSQTSACNCLHEVQQRLARWLLMTQDRAHADKFYLTHLYLAKMLGVRRSAVTIAAGVLQREGIISYSRGQINVLSRLKLERAACKCYHEALDTYDKNLKIKVEHGERK